MQVGIVYQGSFVLGEWAYIDVIWRISVPGREFEVLEGL
jgi:hypothetical protein